jgi:hypothetical protein
MEVCRTKNTNSGASYYQETVDLVVSTWSAAQPTPKSVTVRAARYAPCLSPDDPNSDDVSHQCIGSMIGMGVRNVGSLSTVVVYSAGKQLCCGTGPELAPDWHVLESAIIWAPMTKIGYRGTRDVLFAGTRAAPVATPPAISQLSPIMLPNLPFQESLGVDFGKVVDLSY